VVSSSEQQALPGVDPARVTFLSPSALDRYRRCPRLYRFLHVDGLWRMSRMGAGQSFGTSVHAALREFFRLPVGNRSLERLLELFRRAWVRDGYGSKEQRARERARGIEVLRTWYAQADTKVRPLATEVGLQAGYGDIVLKGRIDRLDAGPDGSFVVVDYKTAKRPASQASADQDVALTIYASLVERKLGRPVTELVLDYVVAGKLVVTSRPPEVLAERMAEVLSAAATLRGDTEFAPRTGPWCKGCDLLSLCPEGQAEVAARTARLD
jgi:putative RecB family exonuclease